MVIIQLLYHYYALRKAFPSIPNEQEMEITIDELGNILCCSRRNVNFILKQMQQEKWIEWKAGRGRGHHSSISYLADVEQLLLHTAKDMVRKGDIGQALALFNEYPINPVSKTSFMDWLNSQMGFYFEDQQQLRKDILKFPFYRPLPALDPALINRSTEVHMVGQIFDTLVKYHRESDAFHPHLSHYWEIDDSGRIWTFYLRKGVYFHHGKEMMAVDVQFSINRLRNKELRSPSQWMFESIKEINIISDRAVQIVHDKPNLLFLYALSSERASILPSDAVEGNDDFRRLPIGTGPFKLVRNDHSMFVLEAFPNYFKGRAHLDVIEVWIIPDSVFYEVSDLEAQHMKFTPFQPNEKGTDYRGVDKVEIGCHYLTFNLSKENILQNSDFRKAIHLLLDRKRMVQELGGHRFSPACSLFPNKSRLYYINSSDVYEAKRLLANSDYQGEKLQLYTYSVAKNKTDAEWIREVCAQMGITIEVTSFEISELSQPHVTAEADMILGGVVSEENLEFFLLDFFRSSHSFLYNHAGYMQPHIDQQVSGLLNEPSREKRMIKLLQLENDLRDEYAVLFLYHARQSSTFHTSLKGVSLNSLGWVDYRELWFAP
ncbi:SgrR family transcriptional regulator [Ammoniphilus sp. CFH 90114]|uniref:SgrR family transcriptional regulator n=1 Tax=Ammoniphilus sp. CFH 90114 TaxID=2493665 RepID=UPI00100FDBD0|nr:SgrR family transcriptional regulator [Ammoniphilus sp. CFH 90114]RXT06262.1 SgrR family transcriptional regulator [Ammoniphilus sp. CFH 90114]